jgi:hypothetical protein
VEVWRATDAVTSIAFDERLLEHLGLTTAHVRATARVDEGVRIPVAGETHSFAAVDTPGLPFTIRNDAFAGFASGEPVLLRHEGGLTLAARPDGAIRANAHAFLYDFAIEIDPARDSDWLKITAGRESSPFDIRDAAVSFDRGSGSLHLTMGDIAISDRYAELLGEPALAGKVIGTIDLRLKSVLIRSEKLAPDKEFGGHPPFTDVKLGEQYGIDWIDRIGTYPNGKLGLSFATTSCNIGTQDVPWLAPMNENHPTIGMALFRLMNDRLEMIGQSWAKHGFFALSDDQCTPCQHGSPNGTWLGVGCSDTYSVFNNASQYYLGARSEVNAHTAEWECLGSYFDGVPVDCVRSYHGIEPNGVNHRLEVFDNDLGLPGAEYFYEGCYYVKNDNIIFNNIGWRECTMNWKGPPVGWDFGTLGGGIEPNPGTVVATWGDQLDTQLVAPNDGLIMLATKVTDLGGGQWHYEYACYNRSSDRQMRSFKVPVGTANLTNVGFHDIDHDAVNDWAVDVSNGFATWSTGAFGEPGSNPLTYQQLFNFRFDADQAPQAGSATGGIYKPGAETEFLLDTQTPPPSATDVVVAGNADDDLVLRAEPNPFAKSTRLAFAMPAAGEARIVVLDVTGRVIRTLVNGPIAAGRGAIEWDGRDAQGSSVTSGVYFFRMEAAGDVRTIKGTLMR